MPKPDKPLLVLLDAHAIIHRAYHALPELTDKDGNPAGALYGLSAMLLKLIKDLKPNYIAAAYDLAGPTHRHDVYDAYKGTRAKTDDALVLQLDRSRDIFTAFHIPLYEAKGFEADDVIGTLAEMLKKKFRIVIASGDMDTLQLVSGDSVQVFTLKKGISDTVLYDEAKVIERFGFTPPHIPDFKGFAGDPSDNIIGIPGIGEKTATKLIQAYGSVESIYKALHKNSETFKAKTGISDRILALLRDHQEEAEFSKVLATIRRDAPVDFNEEASAWKKSFTPDHAVELFTTLGFRSLVPRIEQLSGLSIQPSDKQVKEAAASVLVADDSLRAREVRVAWWLLNSESTNPSTEDVLNDLRVDRVDDAYPILERRLKEADLYAVFTTIEQPLIPVIERVNQHGILINREYLGELSAKYHKELSVLASRIFAKAGREFNINSPKQLGEVLFGEMGIKQVRAKKTATGQLSTKESELLKLKEAHPIVGDILAYRELQKLLSTYIDAIPPLLGEDGRLRTTFIQTGAATGRFASRDPNLQNIPIKTEAGRAIRHAFIAKEGSVLAAFDYSQIELRLAAILSGDEKLRDIFIRGEDVHTAVASEVFNVAPEKVEYEMRRRAKVINFGILYGMGVNALREQLGTSREEAQAYLTRYFETFSGLARYLSTTKANATLTGYTETLFGRKRYFPGLKSKLPFVRASSERMAINAPIQGTQADIIKLAMVNIDALIAERYSSTAGMVLQIHDELIFEVAEAALGEFSQDVTRLMESVLTPEQTRGVPITVSGASGKSWGEMQALQ